MRVFLALIRKNLLDSRWLLIICALALFALSYLFTYAAHRAEVAIQGQVDGRRMGMLRGMGGASMDFSTAAIQVAYWNVPFVTLIFAVWAIARGSIAVAGEIERGTMDLLLSRPVERSTFLLAHVALAALGLLVMGSAMVGGSVVGSSRYALIAPASAATLARPALNLAALGWAIYGYSLLLSTLDLVRWRPNLIASMVTLAEFIALFVSTIPQLEMKWLERYSIFKAYDPVELVVKGETLGFNVGVLGLVGLVGVVASFLVFSRRDLPAGS